MRWRVWIWAVGGAAWLLDALLEARRGHAPAAKLDLMLATLFGLAFAFFAQMDSRPRR